MDVVEVEVYGRPGFAFFERLQADRAMDILFNARIDFKVFEEAMALTLHHPHLPALNQSSGVHLKGRSPLFEDKCLFVCLFFFSSFLLLISSLILLSC
jgi:hypothetical protein